MKICLLIILSFVCFTACKKTEPVTETPTTTITPAIPTDGWLMNGTKFYQWKCNKGNVIELWSYASFSNKNDILKVGFNWFPPPSGNPKYRIVKWAVKQKYGPYPNEALGLNELCVSLECNTCSTEKMVYKSIGGEEKYANVYVHADGKVIVEIPEIQLVGGSLDTTVKRDTVIVTGTLTQD